MKVSQLKMTINISTKVYPPLPHIHTDTEERNCLTHAPNNLGQRDLYMIETLFLSTSSTQPISLFYHICPLAENHCVSGTSPKWVDQGKKVENYWSVSTEMQCLLES